MFWLGDKAILAEFSVKVTVAGKKNITRYKKANKT